MISLFAVVTCVSFPFVMICLNVPNGCGGCVESIVVSICFHFSAFDADAIPAKSEAVISSFVGVFGKEVEVEGVFSSPSI